MTEQELENLISKLADKKSVPDENFKRGLLMQLNMEIKKQENKISQPTINNNFMNKFRLFAFGATAAAAVLLVVFLGPQTKQNRVNFSGKQEIIRASSNAFGSLAQLTTAARGQGGGGNANELAAPTPPTTSTPSTTEGDAKMTEPGMGGTGSDAMIWRPVNYQFVYKGEALEAPANAMTVYERQKGFGGSLNLGAFLSGFNINSFSIDKFANAQLDYITASQNQDFGYTLSIDSKNGSIYIGENWERWQLPERMCQDQACYERYKMTPEQIPADSRIIGIANNFLDEYGIDRSNYGTPYVQDYWRAELARATDRSMVYIPDTISVVYPIRIEGVEAYDEGGNKTGMYVSVNVRHNKVSSVGELNAQRFQASDYPTEQDTAKLIKIAEAGGFRSYYPFYTEDNAQLRTVELGTPTQSLIRMWHYANNQSKELFVPSLVFPVLTQGDDIYMKSVIVPLVKELLDSQQNPPYKIMPAGEAAR